MASPQVRTEKRAAPGPTNVTVPLSMHAWRAVADSYRLSARERELAAGILRNEKEAVIAQNLGISAHTAHTHATRLLRKVGACNRVEVVLRLMSRYLALVQTKGAGLAPLCARRRSGGCPFGR